MVFPLDMEIFNNNYFSSICAEVIQNSLIDSNSTPIIISIINKGNNKITELRTIL
jgi:hypothetical protein